MVQAKRPLLFTSILAAAASTASLSWGDTRFLVAFGDSYTANGELESCWFSVLPYTFGCALASDNNSVDFFV